MAPAFRAVPLNAVKAGRWAHGETFMRQTGIRSDPSLLGVIRILGRKGFFFFFFFLKKRSFFEHVECVYLPPNFF